MTRSPLLATIALVSACQMGGSLSLADQAAYDESVTDLVARLDAYCSAAPAFGSTDECRAALQQYLAHARPDVAGMGPMASWMDEHMTGGDMRCSMDGMARELERHAATACSSGDMAASRDEAQRHCGEMQGYADHLRMRGAQAAGMMGGGMMGGGMMGGAMGCCGGASDGGWMMRDGGLMGWDHHTPGCPADGG